MSVSTEVSELRVKIAKLQNDLWHMSSQKDAAIASTQALIQVISKLTTKSSNEASAIPRPHTENEINERGEFAELLKKNEDFQKTIKQLEEQLAASEKLRKNLQIINRNLASKKTAYSGDLSEDEGSFANDESRSAHEFGRQAKRSRNTGMNKHDRSPSLGFSTDIALRQAGASKLPAASVPAIKSSTTATPTVVPEEQNHAASLAAESLAAEGKAAKRAEDARLLNLKLEKLKQIKLSQSTNQGSSDKFIKNPLGRTTTAPKSAPTSTTTSQQEMPCLGSLIKDGSFVKSVLSDRPSLPSYEEEFGNKKDGSDDKILHVVTVAVGPVTPQGKRKCDEQHESNEYYPSPYDQSGSNKVDELNYDEEYDSDGNSDDGLAYKNEEEIDLELSEDDKGGSPDREDSTSYAAHSSLISLNFQHFSQQAEPYVPLSAALQAIDNPRWEWEESGDGNATPEVVEAVASPKKFRTPEEAEQYEIEKAKAARLLGPYLPEHEQGQAAEVMEFFVPEPGTSYKTGLILPNMQEIEERRRIIQECNDAKKHKNNSSVQDIGDEAFSLNSSPNKQLWSCDEERAMALSDHLAEERYLVNFHKFGLFYVPSPAEIQKGNVYRTVHIANLPDETTIGDLMARIRGGIVISANILDTKKLLGSKSALVVFMNAESAESYVSFSQGNPISFGKNTASITLINTPTYPMRAGLAISTTKLGHTRCIQISGYPKHYIPDKNLIIDLTTKMSFHSAMPDAFRAAGMEEPSYDDETGVLKLEFSSVELASSAYGILKGLHTYRQYFLSPVFVEDPCAGDLTDLFSLPPMAYEVAVKGAKPTPLQQIQASFQPQPPSRHEITMPEVPSFHFQMPVRR